MVKKVRKAERLFERSFWTPFGIPVLEPEKNALSTHVAQEDPVLSILSDGRLQVSDAETMAKFRAQAEKTVSKVQTPVVESATSSEDASKTDQTAATPAITKFVAPKPKRNLSVRVTNLPADISYEDLTKLISSQPIKLLSGYRLNISKKTNRRRGDTREYTPHAYLNCEHSADIETLAKALNGLSYKNLLLSAKILD